MHISGGNDDAFEHGWGGFGEQGIAIHVHHAGLAEGGVRFHHVFQEFDEELPDGRERIRLGEGEGEEGKEGGWEEGKEEGREEGKEGGREEATEKTGGWVREKCPKNTKRNRLLTCIQGLPNTSRDSLSSRYVWVYHSFPPQRT